MSFPAPLPTDFFGQLAAELAHTAPLLMEHLPLVGAQLTEELLETHLGDLARWSAVLEAGLRPELIAHVMRPRPRRGAKNRKEGLLLVDPEPLATNGDCPGGRYTYVTEPGLAIRLLDWWANQAAWAAVDLETSVGWRPDATGGRHWVPGSDAFTSKIMLCSVSVQPGEAVVFDFRKLQGDPGFDAAFARFLSEARVICHNAQFEQGFFHAQYGRFARVVLDTMVMHQLLTAGLPEGSDLESVTRKYTGNGLEKKWQKFFIQIHPESPLPNDAIRYAAGDVSQLLEIAKAIDAEYRASGQYAIWSEIEQPFMPVVAQAIATGIQVDRTVLERLRQQAETDRDRHGARFAALAPGVLISSWQQLLAWFAGQSVVLVDTEADSLKALLRTVPAGSVVAEAATALLGYRDGAKMASTYIRPYLGPLVNPVTGRIHPQWKQASTVTGRMAAAKPNLQNIPAHEPYVELRTAIVAPSGMMLAYIDYSQFEVRALADAANEPRMLTVFREAAQVNEQLRDYCRTAGLDYSPDSLADLSSKEKAAYAALCTVHPTLAPLVTRAFECDFHRRTAALLFHKPVTEVSREERSKAKTVTFALPYGAGPTQIAAEAGISREEAKQLIKEYERQFPRVKEFLQKCKAQGRAGQTQTAAGRKRRYVQPDERVLFHAAVALKADPTQLKKWQEWIVSWRETEPAAIAAAQYRAAIGKIEREATNQPIQGANADATKLASVLVQPDFAILGPDCQIILWVHDEVVIQAPADRIEAAAVLMQRAMVTAGKRFLHRCPVETSCTISNRWGK